MTMQTPGSNKNEETQPLNNNQPQETSTRRLSAPDPDLLEARQQISEQKMAIHTMDRHLDVIKRGLSHG